MKAAIVDLVSSGPYSQSRHYDKDTVPPLSKESPNAYEQRTWRNRMHVTKDGRVEIPGTCFANCVKQAAARLSLPVPSGKGKTFSKTFASGIMVVEGVALPLRADKVVGEKLFVPSNGQPGGGKRVYRWFPLIPEWEGRVTFHIFDDLITQDVFEQTVKAAGIIVGIGRFRPENRGYYGRFAVKKLKWVENSEHELAKAG